MCLLGLGHHFYLTFGWAQSVLTALITDALQHVRVHLDFKTKSSYRAFNFGCGTKGETKQVYTPHSRLLFSIHLQAVVLLYFFILETHSAILISGYRLIRVHVP